MEPLKRFDPTEDKKYKRIYAGVAWPGERPGFAVILGEEREGVNNLIFLDEIEAGDIRSLIRQCGAMDYYYRPDAWYGETKNSAAMEFIREMNKDNSSLETGRAGAKKFILRRSRQLDSENPFEFFFPRLKSMLEPKNRRLFLKESKLKAYMYQPQEADLAGMKWGMYPAIEALALVALELDEASRRSDQKQYDKVDNEYVRI